MTKLAANGIESLRAKLIADEGLETPDGKVTPIFYTMGIPGAAPVFLATAHPILSTQPAPIYTTQPAPAANGAKSTSATLPAFAPDDPLYPEQGHLASV